MKIGIAQIQAVKKEVHANIWKHLYFIGLGVQENVDSIIFPELSITGDGSTEKRNMALRVRGQQLSVIRSACSEHSISVVLGSTILQKEKHFNGLVLYEAQKQPRFFSQEVDLKGSPVISESTKSDAWKIGSVTVVPSLGLESMTAKTRDEIIRKKAHILLACCAFGAGEIADAYLYFPKLARELSVSVVFANRIQPEQDEFSTGNSAVWNPEGDLVGCLGGKQEELLLFDLNRLSTKRIKLPERNPDWKNKKKK